MKKFILSILAVVYIITSSGAVVHLHYCMDKLISWGLWDNKAAGDKCDKCGMSKSKKSCCKDKNTFVKITKDQKAIKESINLSRPVFNLAVQPSHYSSLGDVVTITCKYPPAHDPPPAETVSLFVLNSVFRI